MSLADKSVAWLEGLEQWLTGQAQPAFSELFLEECYWRDMVSLTWDTRQFWGGELVEKELRSYAAPAGVRKLRLDPERSAPAMTELDGQTWIELFFAFETATGSCKGFARLAPDESERFGMRAQLVATSLVALHCAPDSPGRHARLGFDPAQPGQTWAEWRADKSDFSNREPDVLIIGGSHSGLSLGARFERKGISYLIIEKNQKPGDMWRSRYEALALHTNTPANDLPYIPLPKHWGTFTPKDQWADWLDSYASLMDLNFLGGTEAVGGSFDEEKREWEVRTRQADGSLRTFRPKHVVLAVGGVGGKPRVPDLPGLKSFGGKVLHSSAFKSGAAYTGQKVMVVGSSTTAHDICLDLYNKGAAPTMAQRGATCVVNIDEVVKFTGDYQKVSVDEADQRRSATFVLPLLIKRTQANTVRTEREHADLHAGLRKAGQKLTVGHDNTGWLMKLFRDLAGYYLNIGCSDAIIEGKVKVLDFDTIAHFTASGVQLRDGSAQAFDTIVLATGYQDLSRDIEALFGAEVAGRVGKGIGLAEDGEYRNMSRPTGQPHLWVMLGGIIDARRSSDPLAMQIIAQMKGLVPTLVRQADGSSKPFEAEVPVNH
ncbi:MAG: NAD(P)/FAD-dependent oxidoreductase [Pseudomonadota bacterium]